MAQGEITVRLSPMFYAVKAMNDAFGNPQGNPNDIDWEKIRKQCLSMLDEGFELMVALGADKTTMKELVKRVRANIVFHNEPNLYETRDALCDSMVFDMGAYHLLGLDADLDMDAVIAGVMTRFCRDQAELDATIQYWAEQGVPKIYVEGEFPKKIVKSAEDQPDAPKGKFLKSVGYRKAVFPPVPLPKSMTV